MRFGLCLLGGAAALLLSFASKAAEPVNAQQAAEWREDLAFMARDMERRHANLFHTVRRDAFHAQVNALHEAIPTLGRNRIIVGMMRIAASVGDGHTNVSPLKDPKFQFGSVPVRFYDFEDGVHVFATAPGFERLLGAKLVGVGAAGVDEVRGEIAQLSARDNRFGERVLFPVLLAMPPVLEALGYSAAVTHADYRFEREGRAWTERLPVHGVLPVWPPDTDISLIAPEGWTTAAPKDGPALWLRAPLDLHRFVELPERQALYVQLNMVSHIDGETLAQFGERILAYARKQNPKRIVLDVRLNRGGNHDLRFPFIASLVRAEDADTALYVLVGRGSFSATQAILDDLSDYTDARLVGEPASSKPNSFSDSYRQTMPNSGVAFRTSIQWNQTDQSTRPWTAIDEALPPTFADYRNGRDAALEFALSSGMPMALSVRLLEVARAGTLERVVASAQDYLGSPRVRFQDLDAQVFEAAEALNTAGHKALAVDVARLATGRSPDSTDAWTVLALFAQDAGDTATAIEAARKAVALDPNNRSVRSILQ